MRGVKYKRRRDLEKKNHHILIVDVIAESITRIICLYRSFRPLGGVIPSDLFLAQLDVVKNAICTNSFLLGDFNLDKQLN